MKSATISGIGLTWIYQVSFPLLFSSTTPQLGLHFQFDRSVLKTFWLSLVWLELGNIFSIYRLAWKPLNYFIQSFDAVNVVMEQNEE